MMCNLFLLTSSDILILLSSELLILKSRFCSNRLILYLQLVRTPKPLVRIPDFQSHLISIPPFLFEFSLGLFSPFQDFKPFVSIPDFQVTLKFCTRAYLLDFKISKAVILSKSD